MKTQFPLSRLSALPPTFLYVTYVLFVCLYLSYFLPNNTRGVAVTTNLQLASNFVFHPQNSLSHPQQSFWDANHLSYDALDASKMSKNWRGANYTPEVGNATVSFTFQGNALYIYFTLINLPSTDTTCIFRLDGLPIGLFHHSSDESGTTLYDVLAFHKADLEDTHHNFVIELSGDQPTTLVFDRALYSSFNHADPVYYRRRSLSSLLADSVLQSRDDAGPDHSVSRRDTNNSKGNMIAIIVGGVVGGLSVLGILAFIAYYTYVKQRMRREEEVERKRDSEFFAGSEAPPTPTAYSNSGAADRSFFDFRKSFTPSVPPIPALLLSRYSQEDVSAPSTPPSSESRSLLPPPRPKAAQPKTQKTEHHDDIRPLPTPPGSPFASSHSDAGDKAPASTTFGQSSNLRASNLELDLTLPSASSYGPGSGSGSGSGTLSASSSFRSPRKLPAIPSSSRETSLNLDFGPSTGSSSNTRY